MDEDAFQSIADTTLTALMDQLDAALGDRWDIDLESGVLTVELDSGAQYLLNKHAPMRQLWLSSPALLGSPEATFSLTARSNSGVSDTCIARQTGMHKLSQSLAMCRSLHIPRHRFLAARLRAGGTGGFAGRSGRRSCSPPIDHPVIVSASARTSSCW